MREQFDFDLYRQFIRLHSCVGVIICGWVVWSSAPLFGVFLTETILALIFGAIGLVCLFAVIELSPRNPRNP